MPLDEIGRKYADELFKQNQKAILSGEEKQLAGIQGQSVRPGLILPGHYLDLVVKFLIERTRLLASAKVESVLAAYDRSGLMFDDVALAEVSEEVIAFCNGWQHREVGFLARLYDQPFLMNPSPKARSDAIVQLQTGVSSVMEDTTAALRIRRYEVALDDRRARKVYAAGLGKKWDVFISHASEDKVGFVRPLADALTRSGLSVWYDETTLRVGDSLRKAIDHGLANSRFGVVVLSHYFFAKQWPQQELDGLFTKEVEGVKVILPIWHNISADEVRQYSPMLAGKVAGISSAGLEVVVLQLREAMGMA